MADIFREEQKAPAGTRQEGPANLLTEINSKEAGRNKPVGI
jgi:hypothetical protein